MDGMIDIMPYMTQSGKQPHTRRDCWHVSAPTPRLQADMTPLAPSSGRDLPHSLGDSQPHARLVVVLSTAQQFSGILLQSI